MTNTGNNIFILCHNLLRDIVWHFCSLHSIENENSEIQVDFLPYIKKKLRLSKIEDYHQLCIIMDLLGDADAAKENFERFGVQGPTKYTEYGEQLIRVYGLLNVVYQEFQAIKELSKIVNYIDLETETKINNLDIFKVRHFTSSHSLNYADPLLNYKKNPFQTTIRDNKLLTWDSQNRLDEFDLMSLLAEYNSLAKEYLLKTTEKYVHILFRKQSGGKEYTKEIITIRKIFEGKIERITFQPISTENIEIGLP